MGSEAVHRHMHHQPCPLGGLQYNRSSPEAQKYGSIQRKHCQQVSGIESFFGLTLTFGDGISFLRHLESSVESPVELLGEDAITFFLVAPFLWSFQEIRFAILHLLSNLFFAFSIQM